ncbi:hypothetical protein CDD80_1371 [Ophiocordyceps camponoti-rufipedis]|uniref:Uncharacterized protein n=1 Tax=Ophiocordyceps camponoti-rufipedis TaxID=2004952 RepID=A0A2C5Y3K4_9HYPO|nr:hypothetical protein CDD80_1371 [Ophiocordyceps camponoti-rufipedis]
MAPSTGPVDGPRGPLGLQWTWRIHRCPCPDPDWLEAADRGTGSEPDTLEPAAAGLGWAGLILTCHFGGLIWSRQIRRVDGLGQGCSSWFPAFLGGGALP